MIHVEQSPTHPGLSAAMLSGVSKEGPLRWYPCATWIPIRTRGYLIKYLKGGWGSDPDTQGQA